MIRSPDLARPGHGRRSRFCNLGLFLCLVVGLLAAVPAAGGTGGVGDSDSNGNSADDRGPIYLTGTLSASFSLYDASGRPDAREPSSWMLRGAPTLHLFGVDVPLSLTLTEQDRIFRQPLNRLGAHPRLGGMTGHLGYSSLSWSPFSLAGQSILGLGLEGKSGAFDFGAIGGRLRREVEATEVEGVGNVAPVYRRLGYALRFGVSHDDLHLGLIVVRGADDENSLSVQPSSTVVTPQENLVVSAVGHWSLDDRWSLDCELAQTAYTDDKRSDRQTDGYDKILLQTFGALMPRRTATRQSQALSAKLGWQEDRGGIDVSYRRIDPGYRSMGAYYFNADLENVTIEPKLKLSDGRLRLAGSIGFQHDNLSDEKDLQTTRTIGSGRLDWTPSSTYMANLTYANYSLDQKAGRSALDSTSVKIAQSTSNLGVTQSLTRVGTRVSQNAVLIWSRQDMEDRTVNGSLDASYTAHQLNATYTFTWIPWGLSVNLGYNRATYDAAAALTKVIGPQVGANWAFWRHKATLGAGASLSTTSVDDQATVRTSLFQLQAALRPQRRHRITLRLSIHHDEAKTPTGTDDTETRGEIGYAYSF